MSGIATAIVGSAVVGAVASNQAGKKQAQAADRAAQAQTQSADASIAEQQRQFDLARETLSPYVKAGVPALGGLESYAGAGVPALEQQQAYLGLQGPQAQQAFIDSVSGSPEMAEMVRQGEEGILQNAAATGGLRGGNTQAALAQFRPSILQHLIEQRYGRLGGMVGLGEANTQNLASLGQASAAGQANLGLQTGANIGNTLTARGDALGGAEVAKGVARSQMYDSIANSAGTLGGIFLKSRL